jgi:hypothetical protein
VSTDYDGRQYVWIDRHCRRSVIVRMTPDGEQLGWVHIDNDLVVLGLELAKAGPDPEVVLGGTVGWYWAVDALQAAGAWVHLAHPLGVKALLIGESKMMCTMPQIYVICCVWVARPKPTSPLGVNASRGNWHAIGRT